MDGGFRDDMGDSYGTGYATRSSDEGYGEGYGEAVKKVLEKKAEREEQQRAGMAASRDQSVDASKHPIAMDIHSVEQSSSIPRRGIVHTTLSNDIHTPNSAHFLSVLRIRQSRCLHIELDNFRLNVKL